jgi:hypothetical protein
MIFLTRKIHFAQVCTTALLSELNVKMKTPPGIASKMADLAGSEVLNWTFQTIPRPGSICCFPGGNLKHICGISMVKNLGPASCFQAASVEVEKEFFKYPQSKIHPWCRQH